MRRADEAAVLQLYRELPASRRREIAAASSPGLRAQLHAIEREMALDRSPGAMAAVLTDGREMQAAHLAKIDAAFERVASGQPTRLLLTMPPRHGKSRRAARWGPLWYLRRRPEHRVMIASYSSDLADDHGRWIRDAIQAYGPQLGMSLRAGSSAANRFDLAGTEGGAVMAGVGGGLTGKGAHLAVVDDPIKDAQEASSPTMRKRLWEWWQAVLLTRIEPGGSVILIQTRWDEDDLAGRILADERDRWTVIDLPALALADDDALGREVGTPLWPHRYDTNALAEIRRSVGERVWWSLYQQQPRPQEGGVWQWSWIANNRISAARFRGVDLARIVVAVDPAGGESTVGDETGIVAAARDRDGHLYVLDDRSGNRGAESWGRETCLLAIELRADAIVVESNYGGDMSRQILHQAWTQLQDEDHTDGMLMPAVLSVTAKHGKRLRAEPIAQLYDQGRVHHVGEWPALEQQMVTWVAGMDSPDRMDAAVHALTQLADPQQASAGASAYNDARLTGRR
ncbi:terminase large subunit domain-containing protein [Streptomyces sp. CBMA152]|uniref:terminase large subunit domain-containing protein n=1 Tax=Streptomyces sp. CBMA152 TaxID=1896312 RepID=UPI0016602DE9|nr:terminase family protein [Streptomyces sp. CBMA152]MBD0741923.1 terminase, large subunit [Streptomyces sp. CBMA152]